jgi:regulator of protease activity HflC (stomatin/prohibitin superfamily)
VFISLGFAGLFTVNPNEARVLTLFGRYIGTVRTAGLWFANPFFAKKRISLRVRNFETAKLKVNDNHSNPIEIAAVVVWRVIDSAEALFEVDDYQHYVQTQSESAVRALAQSYPYDAHLVEEIALSTHPAEVAKGLQSAIQERLEKAGVNVIEARISHLAYAPEIASAMLRRQQASAIIAARAKIVEGAVGMVENALELISQKSLVALDDERKAAMALCRLGRPRRFSRRCARAATPRRHARLSVQFARPGTSARSHRRAARMAPRAPARRVAVSRRARQALHL